MSKQTAVEWLESKINKYIDYYEGKRDAMPYSLTDLDSAVQQAKEMEKQQIVNSWDLSRRDIDYPADGEKYYNETYNQP
jgi:hypothetical protein